MRAWFAGAFEHCLELCAVARPRDTESKMHLALITARALLRLERPDEALTVLRDAAAIPCKADESADGSPADRRRLRASRRRRARPRNTRRRAARCSRSTSDDPIRDRAQPRARASTGARDLEDAERALDLVRSDADIVYARALEYRGWLAFTRADGERRDDVVRQRAQGTRSLPALRSLSGGKLHPRAGASRSRALRPPQLGRSSKSGARGWIGPPIGSHSRGSGSPIARRHSHRT